MSMTPEEKQYFENRLNRMKTRMDDAVNDIRQLELDVLALISALREGFDGPSALRVDPEDLNAGRVRRFLKDTLVRIGDRKRRS